MTVATFVQPNMTTSPSVYKAAIDAAIAVLATVGADYACHEKSTPDMQVLVDAGQLLLSDGTLISSAQQTSITIVAPATNPRIDRIVINDRTGVMLVLTGTPAASPTAPAITAGMRSIAQILLQTSSTVITNSMITDERCLLSSLPLTTYTQASLVGSGLAIATVGNSALTRFYFGSKVTVAHIDDTNDLLRVYSFDGSAWSLYGSGLAITTVGTPALAALNSSDVAFFDSTNIQLRTYRFNGSTWSQVGSGLTITGAGVGVLTALNSTDVAFIDTTNNQLRTYRFNGSTWSQVGSGLTITGNSTAALTALSSTDVAHVSSGLNDIGAYRFDGSAWSLVGSRTGSLGTVINVSMSALNTTDVVLVESNSDELMVLRFNGSTWSRVGQATGITVAGNIALVALNGIEIALIDSTVDELRTYRFGCFIGSGPHHS